MNNSSNATTINSTPSKSELVNGSACSAAYNYQQQHINGNIAAAMTKISAMMLSSSGGGLANGHHHHLHQAATNNNSEDGSSRENSNKSHHKHHHHQQHHGHHYPQWYDIDIKGLVKNISPKLWQWTHLSRLCLNDNNLIRLPPVVSNLVNLQYLDVSNNKIRTLPAEIGDMTCLRELYLNYNQLRVLPFELGKLFKLNQLGLKGNPLTNDIMQIYSESNGTQKLLISLLDQLSITCTAPPRRPWMILAEPNLSLNSCIFTTMCYNVLCDKYATRQFYGYCPAWALAWDYRKKLILDDIKTLNADIICLQELETEQFYQYFLPELKQCDYDGIFSPKSRAKTMSEHDKKHVDGCAIFFKTSRFQLVKDYLIEFNQIAMAAAEGSEDMLNRVMTKDNIGLAALLEVKQEPTNNSSESSTNKTDSSSPSPPINASSLSQQQQQQQQNKQLLLVSTAHIHWDPEYCDVKLIQTLMLINELRNIIEQALREFQPQRYAALSSQATSGGKNGNSNSMGQGTIDCSSCIPVVMCADLNSLPESGVIEYLRSGHILANHVDFKELGYDSCLQKINTSERPSELSHNLKLECAYEKDVMPYTNYTYDFKGVIDYIFYSSRLMRTVGILGPLDIDWLKGNKVLGFPHPHVPSDHLPLMVELELINPNLSTNNLNTYFGNTNTNNTSNVSSSTNNNTYQQQQQSSSNGSNISIRPSQNTPHHHSGSSGHNHHQHYYHHHQHHQSHHHLSHHNQHNNNHHNHHSHSKFN